MYGALLASVIFNFLRSFAQGIGMLIAGSVLLGLPWGVFQTLTVTYASDITSSTILPYLTTYINLCWVMGSVDGEVVRNHLGSYWPHTPHFSADLICFAQLDKAENALSPTPGAPHC